MPVHDDPPDGIRLKNSVYHDGPNQSWNTVDPLSVEQLDVARGSGSVTHGGDAVD
jgi:hemoglobin/transferrin/lactoferrin receptor protein